MRRRGRVDGNHSEIVRVLRLSGATVQSLADVGNGCPDLLVGFKGKNWLMEVKDGTAAPSKRKLTEDEMRWHEEWRGNTYVVYSEDDALDVLFPERGK